jgi:Inner membrane component domain
MPRRGTPGAARLSRRDELRCSPVGFLYTLVIGIPYCLVMVTVGLILCVTLIGAPLGIVFIALGVKGLTIQRPRYIIVRR